MDIYIFAQNLTNMKKLVFLALLIGAFANAQVFTGKGDQKFQIGANIQDNATGVVATFDKGLGTNFSIGLVTGYLLGVEEIAGEKPKFDERFDLRVRFNANIADVIGIEEKVDIYPGLGISLNNFGAHLGARYFFTEGFGIYSEFQVPIASYDSDVVGFDHYNNQFNFSIGASFNL